MHYDSNHSMENSQANSPDDACGSQVDPSVSWNADKWEFLCALCGGQP